VETKQVLKDRLSALAALPETASAEEKRKRGRDLENWLNDLFQSETLSPRLRIRPEGEEIDGSIVLDNQVLLVEAKWHAKPLPASSIYQFKGKVDGKLVGTIGLFISLSGYSEDAIDALTHGKDLNVILFDREAIEDVVDNPHGFRGALLDRLRIAAETGMVYAPMNVLNKLRKPVEKQPEDKEDETRSLLFIVEGATDQLVLSSFVQTLQRDEDLNASVEFLAAGGKMNAARLAEFLAYTSSANKEIIVVADTDGDRAATMDLFKPSISKNVRVILADPEIEAWLYPDVSDPKQKLQQEARARRTAPRQLASELVQNTDVGALTAQNADFAALRKIISARRTPL
jgi:hypothetical protein